VKSGEGLAQAVQRPSIRESHGDVLVGQNAEAGEHCVNVALGLLEDGERLAGVEDASAKIPRAQQAAITERMTIPHGQFAEGAVGRKFLAGFADGLTLGEGGR
jgi:hypothetical protein